MEKQKKSGPHCWVPVSHRMDRPRKYATIPAVVAVQSLILMNKISKSYKGK